MKDTDLNLCLIDLDASCHNPQMMFLLGSDAICGFQWSVGTVENVFPEFHCHSPFLSLCCHHSLSSGLNLKELCHFILFWLYWLNSEARTFFQMAAKFLSRAKWTDHRGKLNYIYLRTFFSCEWCTSSAEQISLVMLSQRPKGDTFGFGQTAKLWLSAVFP